VIDFGKVKKGVKCSVVGCERDAARSLSPHKISGSGLDVKEGHRVFLCSYHYREYKKRTRKQRMIESWRYTVQI